MIVDGMHGQLLVLVICIATVYVGLFLWPHMFGAMVRVAILITQLIGCEVARATKLYELVRYNSIQNM